MDLTLIGCALSAIAGIGIGAMIHKILSFDYGYTIEAQQSEINRLEQTIDNLGKMIAGASHE
jgi:hypothetical protein|tara:strand:- start:227 stop:412 length:186 start_codon:yes stop_codon:yes gene_type:complete